MGTQCLSQHVLPSAQTYTCILRFTAKTVYTTHLPLLSCVVRHCHTWAVALLQHKRLLGAGGIYTLTFPPQWLSTSSSSLQHAQNRAGALSPSIIDLKPPSKSIDFPSILEGKGSKTWLESSSIDSSNSKEHLVHVLVGGCVCYSWSLAPSQLEHRLRSLPTCVAP